MTQTIHFFLSLSVWTKERTVGVYYLGENCLKVCGIIPSWKKFSENFLKFTEIYLNHIWKIAYYHFVPLNQFWTHFSNIAELSEKSELFWICLKNLNCFENCWNSLNSICIVLKQSELFWILLKQSELF